MALINGTAGSDILVGTAADDTINGFAGNDILEGGAGNDLMFGGDGNDTFRYVDGQGAGNGEEANGGDGNDKILITGAGTYDLREFDADSIEEIEFFADGSNIDKTIMIGSVELDSVAEFSSTLLIDGNNNPGADDTIEVHVVQNIQDIDISGWTFEDWRSASTNFDNVDWIKVFGSAEDNIIQTTSVDDEVHGGDGDDIITTNDGNDLVFGEGGVDEIHGGDGDDIIEGGFTIDTIFGDDGDDILRVLNGEFYDNSHGGNGTDTLDHSASTYTGNVFDFENQTMVGEGTGGITVDVTGIEIYLDGSGSNTIISSGRGQYFGNDGDDLMLSEDAGLSGGVEEMDGGAGIDTIDHRAYSGAYNFDMITGLTNFAGEKYTNFENVIMGDGDDTVVGTAGANIITLNGGDDAADGGSGNDLIKGGVGNDILTGGKGADTVKGNDGDDVLKGNKGADNLNGGVNKDTLLGGKGNDTLNGGKGGDILNGGKGNDVITGGKGADVFVFTSNAGKDVIKDFKDGTDLLDFSAFGFASKAEAKSHFFEKGSANNDVVGFEFDGTEIKIKGLDLGDINNADIII